MNSTTEPFDWVAPVDLLRPERVGENGTIAAADGKMPPSSKLANSLPPPPFATTRAEISGPASSTRVSSACERRSRQCEPRPLSMSVFTARCRRSSAVTQRLLMHAEILRDMHHRALRLEHEPHRTLAQLIRILPRGSHDQSISSPQNNARDQSLQATQGDQFAHNGQ